MCPRFRFTKHTSEFCQYDGAELMIMEPSMRRMEGFA